MGKRGPLPGKGGAPPLEQRKRKRPASKTADRESLLASLSKMTLKRLTEHCNKWRTLDAADEVALLAFWDVIKRYNQMQKLVSGMEPIDWGQGEGKSLLIQIKAHTEQMLQFCQRFGMTPADRARLGEEAKKSTGDSHFAGIMSRAGQLSDLN